VADRLSLVVPHPDADRDIRIEADEPRVAVVVGRPGFSSKRPSEFGCRTGGPALHHAAQQVGHHERRVRPDGILGFRLALFEHVSVAVGNLQNGIRVHADAPVRKHRIRRGHVQERQVCRAKRQRQVRLEARIDAQPLRIGDHLLRPQ